MPNPTPATAATRYRVVAEGAVVNDGAHFENREDAESWAAMWNDSYPPSEGYAEFTVEEVKA